MGETKHLSIGHPVLFIRKNIGDLWMCIDFRILNRNTRQDRFPLLRIDDMLDKIASSRYFTKIDLENTYHQIEIALIDQCNIYF